MSNCHHWIGAISQFGYGRFGYKKTNQQAHRVSYELYKGDIGEGLHVLHSCDNRWCVNPDHLRLGTATENMLDRSMRFEFKVTKSQLLNIKQLLNEGLSLSKIAAKVGVTKSYVGLIKLNKRRIHAVLS